MKKQQRQFYRIQYPAGERPLISIAGVTYEVLDLSEAGVRFSVPKAFSTAQGASILGSIRFRDGKACDIVGEVLRINAADKTCVLRLTDGVPLTKMMEEQRYMLKKYPELK